MATYTSSSEIQKAVKPRDLASAIYDAEDMGALDTDAKVSVALADTTATAVLTAAIAKASNLIDFYLLGHVDMTSATNQAKVLGMCTDIALYYIFRRQYMENEENPYYEGYRQAERRLMNVATRKLHLQSDSEVPDTQTRSSTSSTTKTLTDDSLEGF